MSGSGVLLGGEMASGVITILGLSCRRKMYFSFQVYDLFTKSSWEGGGEIIINLQK